MKSSLFQLSVLLSFCAALSLGKELVDRTKELPDINTCVYSREVLKQFFGCLFERINQEISEYFLNAMKEIFPGMDYTEAIQFICKSNNDDGQMLIQMVRDTHGEDVIMESLGSIWFCFDKYQHLLL